MRAAAELNGHAAPRGVVGVGGQRRHVLTDAHHAHGVGVGLAEHGAQAVDGAGLGQREVLVAHRQRAVDDVLHNGLHLSQLLGLQALQRAEVEAELVGADVGALLVNIVAQHLAEGEVQHVGHRVVGRHVSAVVVVHLHHHLVADVDSLALRHGTNVQHEALERLGVRHGQHRVRSVGAAVVARGGGDQVADVRALATLLVVERGHVQHNAHDLVLRRAGLHEAGGRCGWRDAVGSRGRGLITREHGQHACLGRRGPVVLERVLRRREAGALELGSVLRLQDQRRDAGVLGLAGRKLVLLELLVERRLVDGEASLLGHERGQVHREAVRGVQLEGLGASHNVGARSAVGLEHLLELPHALLEGRLELRLLLLDDLGHELLAGGQLGEVTTQDLHHGGHQLVEALRGAEHLGEVPHAAAQNAAQDVAAVVVGGHAAVADGEAQGADVVRDNAVRHVDVVGVLGTDLAGVGAGA